MKKRIKKTLSMILSLAMIITMIGGYHGKKVSAAVKTQCTTYEGSNVGVQNYLDWSDPLNSHLTPLDDGSLMRVQYVNKIKKILVEYYDKDYNLTDTKIVDRELPLFGGFYATDDNYYVITGQNNTEEDNTKEVYRITKYDKNWNKITSTGLTNCNTTKPFNGGSCRMDVSGKYMIIHTCHEMYQSSDGLNHQANATIQVDIDEMKITDSFTKVINSSYGYVSHSFNQFVKIEDGHIVALDHGDAYPRSFVILKYKTDINSGTFAPSRASLCTDIPVLKFKGNTGDNITGASVGGFELSDDHYLTAANTVTQDDNFRSYNTRNVFVAAVDKSTSDVKINYLTNYAEGEETTTTPQLVKISGSRFMVLWTRGDQVYYTLVDNNGEQVGTIHHFAGNLSDCQPVVSKGKVIWYTWNNGDINFYDINTTDLSDYNVTEIHNGHQYVYDSDTDDTVTFKCKECGAVKTEKKMTFTKLYWRDSKSNGVYRTYDAVGGWTQKTGNSMVSYNQYTPTGDDVNTEVEAVSSDKSIVSIQNTSGVNLRVTARKAGTATITIKPKYNPKDVHTYKITVFDPLKINQFKADKTTVQLGEKIQLSVEAEGGYGTRQYKFYEENEAGQQTVIRAYSNESSCTWIPSKTGKTTLYAEVKDFNQTIEKKTIENVTVTKKDAPQIDHIKKTYCYLIGAKNETINLKDYLPQDISNVSYEAKITDSSDEIVSQVKKEDTNYSYKVSKTGKAGDEAKIEFTVKSDNYKDINICVDIKLTDQISVSPKEGNEPAIEGSNELTYGQKISELKLNTSKAQFTAEDGTLVSGKLALKDSDKIPEVGTKTVEYIFTPDNEQYLTYTGQLDISVQKATPKLSSVTIDKTVYSAGKHLKDIKFKEGKATVIYDGKEKEISGTWMIKNGEKLLPLGKYKVDIEFTPDDTDHYTTAQITAVGETTINVSTNIKKNDKATISGISYRVTKVQNTKNAEVTITSADKKKTSFTIPDYVKIKGAKCKVVSIAKKAFYKRTKLSKITIGKYVHTIDDNAFNGCKNLKSITIKSTVLKKAGKNAINGIYKKAVIKVPKKQYNKYKKLFTSKTGFKKTMKIKK